MTTIIKPPNPKKIQEQSLIAVPEILFINSTRNDYHYGYRRIHPWLVDFKQHSLKELIDPSRATITLLSRYRKGLPGTEVWICLDTSNGNPDLYLGRIYLWVFKSKDKAEQKYKMHKDNKCFSKLTPPVRCLIVDSFVLV